MLSNNYFKSHTNDLWNEEFNNALDEKGEFDVFKQLHHAKTIGCDNVPSINCENSERLWRVRVQDPFTEQDINVDLYVKGFFGPGSLAGSFYQVKAYEWRQPNVMFQGRSFISPKDALQVLVNEKVFKLNQ